MTIQAASAAPWGSPLLHDISLNLGPGQVAGVMGPNGAGKTTLLRLAAGDFPATRGRVMFRDRAITDWHTRERARHLGVLPQLSLLNFPYLVEEVVLLGRTPHDSGTAVDKHIADQALALTDTGHLRHRLYTQLSGGERQRVQLARVLAQVWQEDSLSGQLLLLDEPTGALDLSHQQQLLCILELLSDRGCAVLVVLHDVNLLAGIAHQLLVLSAGKQVVCGAPDEVLTPELFSKVFNTDVMVQAHPNRGHPLVIPQ